MAFEEACRKLACEEPSNKWYREQTNSVSFQPGKGREAKEKERVAKRMPYLVTSRRQSAWSQQ